MFKVEGLPEGWKAVCFRVPIGNIEHVFVDGAVREAKPQDKNSLIVEKIHPIRIVLEETNEERRICFGEWYESQEGKLMRWPYGGKTDGKHKVWREVKETNEEPKLSLSVADCKAILSGSWATIDKIREFIKDK